jgi:V8-like Glu-specific endopeptidase
MIASQVLAVVASLALLFPATLNEVPSAFSAHSVVRRTATPPGATEVVHRQIVDARLSPYSAIGKFRGTMTCTAAIVLNPRIVITAGHCVTERNGTIKRSNLFFQPAYQSGTDLGRFRATIWAVGANQSFTHESVREASQDWAILLLDRAPAGVHPFLLSYRSLRGLELVERQIFLPAYSSDIVRAEVLSVDSNCIISDLVSDTLIHNCVARPGSSGAPLLLRVGPDYAVIGIHAASMFASGADGRVGKFVGNQAVGSWMFSEAALALSRQLDSAPVQAVNSGEY